MSKALMPHFVPICAALLKQQEPLNHGSTVWLCPNSLVISAGRDKMKLQRKYSGAQRAQLPGQDRLGSQDGGFRACHGHSWCQHGPAGLPGTIPARNPQSPTPGVGGKPLCSCTPHTHPTTAFLWPCSFPVAGSQTSGSLKQIIHGTGAEKQLRVVS